MSVIGGDPRNASKGWRLFLVLLAAVQAFLTSGIIFGWAPMQAILINEGVYSELCDEGTSPDINDVCPERKAKFVLIFTVASSLFALAIWPIGTILDRYGPRVSYILGCVFLIAGSLLFSFADSKKFDVFIYGYCLIALGGPPVAFSFMHLSNLFPSKRGTILSMYNVMIDASSLLFVIFQIIYERGFTRTHIFWGFTGVPVLMLITCPFLWPSKTLQSESSGEGGGDEGGESKAVNPLDPVHNQLTFKDQVRTIAFIFGTVYTSIQLLRVNFYIGTLDFQIEYLGHDLNIDHTHIDIMGKIFGFVLPLGGVASIPIVSFFLDGKGLVPSVWALSIIGLAFGIFNCLPYFYLQIGTFGLMAIFRAFVFGCMSTYVAVIFGFVNFGKLWGLVFSISGVMNIALIFISDYINENGGHYLYPNSALTGLSTLLFTFPIWLLVKSASYKKVLLLQRTHQISAGMEVAPMLASSDSDITEVTVESR